MADTETIPVPKSKTSIQPETPWNVIVHDDPVNLTDYVTYVFMKIFGYDEKTAHRMMMEVHQLKLSVVWSGALEKAEFYAQQLQIHQLKTTIEKAE